MKGSLHTFFLSLVLGILLAAMPVAWAEAEQGPALRDDHPAEYVVQRGDSLWSIASRFLQDPWRWPEVWEVNPDIRDPNLIYPGDHIVLRRDGNGHPRLRVERPAAPATPSTPVSEGGLPVVKLSPQVRVEELAPEAVPVVNMLSVRTFVMQIRVLSKAELESSPYIQGTAEKRLLGGSSGDLVYVRNLPASQYLQYGVYEQVNTYRNDKKKVIGYEMVRVATAKVQRFGDPAELRLEQTRREVREGDIVLPDVGGEEPYFLPHSAPASIQGHILSVVDGVANIGQYQMVTLDMGHKQGVEAGHIFVVALHAEETRDPRTRKPVKGYDRRAGVLLVFQVYENVSFALVMEANRPLHVHDAVLSPQG